MKKKVIGVLGVVGLSLSLSGCGLGKVLNVEKKAPDEFRVVKHAPLEIPYGLTLPVPQPGIQRPQETTPEQEAKDAVFGKEEAEQGEETPVQQIVYGTGYSAQPIAVTTSAPIEEAVMEETLPVETDEATADLLEKLNASEPVANIRQTLEEDFEKMEQTEVPVGKKLLNMASGDKEPLSEVVDPRAEYERLQKNKEEGSSVIDGETPSHAQ